jgi:hypothetical protein
MWARGKRTVSTLRAVRRRGGVRVLAAVAMAPWRARPFFPTSPLSVTSLRPLRPFSARPPVRPLGSVPSVGVCHFHSKDCTLSMLCQCAYNDVTVGICWLLRSLEWERGLEVWMLLASLFRFERYAELPRK